jgi:O-antigen/teichoic acid export membrane protein
MIIAMGRERALVRKTAIYAVGNFASKILAYIMVLVYSYFILPDQMGYYDLILTTVLMLQPLIIFQINDGVYRFLVDGKNDNRQSVLSTGFQFLCIMTGFAEICLLATTCLYHIEYAVWIGLYIASIVFYTYLQDVTRGLGGSKLYAFCGVFNSLIMLVCQLIGLILLHMGVVALLVSNVLANFTSIVLLFIKQKELRSVLKYGFDKGIAGILLRYSAPLVPNTICWWVVNSSDRYIVLFFLGTAFNGIYSIANKFPTILTTVTSIFFLAWQESAIKEYNTPNRDEFFSKIFHRYYVLLLSLSMCAIPATKIIIKLFVSFEYTTAWRYTGFLYIGAVFSALCSFLGMGYQISKDTRRSLATTVFAAFLNLAINVSIIKLVRLQAASFSTFAAYLFLFIIRLKHTKRYFMLTVNWKEFWLLFGVCIVLIAVTLLTDSLILSLVLCIICGIYMIWLNRSLIWPLLSRVLMHHFIR